MPKLEPKQVQKDLEQGFLYGLYWIYGPERLKSLELTRRIQKTFLADIEDPSLSIEKIDGTKGDSSSVLDQSQGMGLFGGGKKLIYVSNADELDNLEAFLGAFAGRTAAADLETVVVCVSKGFDGRKKAFKEITKEYAVIDCAEVQEFEREQWIQYLSSRRKVTLADIEKNMLRALDPWSLEIIDQELQKLELASDLGDERASLISGGGSYQLRDRLIDSFFTRNSKLAFELCREVADQPEFSFPFLGLLAWNARQLQQFLLEKTGGAGAGTKRNPYLQKNLDRWMRFWTLSDLNAWIHELYVLDLSQKSTRLDQLGLWSNLAIAGKSLGGAGASKATRA